MECNEEDWSIECSDDEKYEMDGKVNKKEINNNKSNNIIHSFVYMVYSSFFVFFFFYFGICLE